mmetsp:Transcript_56027/g.103678  ORF Transcript_56027/g.103678 Transcript_56027/m.103678 type:complete len:235 (+) Transcript_56027:725-1429(+)
MHSVVLVKSAATKPVVVNDSSVAEASIKPPTTGTKDAKRRNDVRSPSSRYAATTVKKGPDAFTVSVKEAATCFKLMRPKTMVRNLKRPKRPMAATFRQERPQSILSPPVAVSAGSRRCLACIIPPIRTVVMVCTKARCLGSTGLSLDSMCLLSTMPRKETRYQHKTMLTTIRWFATPFSDALWGSEAIAPPEGTRPDTMAAICMTCADTDKGDVLSVMGSAASASFESSVSIKL